MTRGKEKLCIGAFDFGLQSRVLKLPKQNCSLVEREVYFLGILLNIEWKI